MPEKNINPHWDEATALLDLGLNADALLMVERLLAGPIDRHVHATALEVFIRLAIFDRAAQAGDALLKGADCSQKEIFRIALAYNYAGRLQDSYDLEKITAAHSNDACVIRLYGLACKAARLNRHIESLSCLLSCFRYHNIGSWDAHRKIFLDSELATLWEKLPTLPINLREAIRYCNLPFDEILEHNTDTFPLRAVDHLDLQVMPPRFKKLLQPAFSTCFEVNPRMEARHPRLYRDYVRWQESLVQPRLEAFRALRDRVRAIVVEQQLQFAQFQASRGRIACARNHLVCHLEHSAGATLETLPDIEGLRPLLTEFREQYAESPEAFLYLISWQCKRDPENFIRDVHSEMPAINHDSGYAQLALGCMQYRLGNTTAAIEHWKACANKWPKDDAPLMNTAMLLSSEDRWDEANQIIDRLPDQCLQSLLWKNACNAIRERRTFTISTKIYATQSIPTPTFGGLYSGADEEFLLEQKKFTPMKY